MSGNTNRRRSLFEESFDLNYRDQLRKEIEHYWIYFNQNLEKEEFKPKIMSKEQVLANHPEFTPLPDLQSYVKDMKKFLNEYHVVLEQMAKELQEDIKKLLE